MLFQVNTLSSPHSRHSSTKNEKRLLQCGFSQRSVSGRPLSRHSKSSACSCRQNGHSNVSTFGTSKNFHDLQPPYRSRPMSATCLHLTTVAVQPSAPHQRSFRIEDS